MCFLWSEFLVVVWFLFMFILHWYPVRVSSYVLMIRFVALLVLTGKSMRKRIGGLVYIRARSQWIGGEDGKSDYMQLSSWKPGVSEEGVL